MSQTKNLKLNIHDDLNSEDDFNSQIYLYDNWTKIDNYVETLQSKNTEQDAEITSIKEEQATQNSNIQSNITAINKNADDIEEINAEISKLKTDTNINTKTVILTETVEKETDYQLPLNYTVGNSSLLLFWNGALLFEGDDGNYKEVGATGEQSNVVQFGWDLEVGDVLTVEVRGVANEE